MAEGPEGGPADRPEGPGHALGNVDSSGTGSSAGEPGAP